MARVEPVSVLSCIAYRKLACRVDVVHRLLAVILLAAMPAFASGCLETEEEYTLNPDGSGKVEVSFALLTVKSGPQDRDPDAQVKATAKKILEESGGIEAWKDVSFKLRKDGKTLFMGTAYFKDISRLRFGFGDVRVDRVTANPSFTRTHEGEIVLELKQEEQSAEKSVPAKLTEEEVVQKIKAARMEYQQSKLMMIAFASGLKAKVTYRLPGTLTEVTNFTKNPDGTVSLMLEGQKLLEVMDEFVADDEWCKKQILAGRDIVNDGPPPADLNEKLFGEKAPIRAVVTGELKAVFDYESEIAQAKKDYPDLLKKLGIESIPGAPPATGEGFKSLRVGGVQLVRFSDSDSGVRPFSHDAGYTLSLIGELPGAIHSVEGGIIEKAVADSGESLLPEREWDRRINFPCLSKDNTTVIFEVNLRLPGEDVKGLKEVSGKLEYVVAGGLKDVDLGIGSLKAGAKGDKFGAAIESVKPDQWDKGCESLSLRLDIAKDAVKSVTFYDSEGNKLDVSRQGYMSTGTATTFQFSVKGKFPQHGRVVVQVFEELKKYEIAFRLSDVSLTGAPVK